MALFLNDSLIQITPKDYLKPDNPKLITKPSKFRPLIHLTFGRVRGVSYIRGRPDAMFPRTLLALTEERHELEIAKMLRLARKKFREAMQGQLDEIGAKMGRFETIREYSEQAAGLNVEIAVRRLVRTAASI